MYYMFQPYFFTQGFASIFYVLTCLKAEYTVKINGVLGEPDGLNYILKFLIIKEI